MPRSYDTHATLSAFFAALTSSGDDGDRNWSMVYLVPVLFETADIGILAPAVGLSCARPNEGRAARPRAAASGKRSDGMRILKGSPRSDSALKNGRTPEDVGKLMAYRPRQ